MVLIMMASRSVMVTMVGMRVLAMVSTIRLRYILMQIVMVYGSHGKSSQIVVLIMMASRSVMVTMAGMKVLAMASGMIKKNITI